MTITIFEGPDGAGKSTLAEAWIRKLEARNSGSGYVITKANHGPYLGEVDVAPHYLEDLVLATPPRKWHVVMDRCWISEAVYGPVMRGADRIDVARRRVLERVALAAGALLVYCLPPYEECRKAYLARKQTEYPESEDQLRRLYDGFAALAEVHSPVTHFWYDWTINQHRSTLIEMAEELRPPANEGPGVGRWAPGEVTLLVGEQLNNETALAPLPFVSWHPSGCVAWLSERLEEWRVPESALYWVNANDARGRPTEATYWLEKLQPRQVIALGEAAQEWCVENVKRFKTVPHPQYWKRFHYHELYPLKELLT